MTTWMFVALLWFEGGTPWPDVIWSFTYAEHAGCEQARQDSAQAWGKKPKVLHLVTSECFRWVAYRGKEV